MNEEQDVFEQFSSSNFKLWSSSALKTLNNCSIVMANNNDNKKI